MCVYRTNEGICKKFSVDGALSYCLDGPCQDEVFTNGDRIRSMSDEELAGFMVKYEGTETRRTAWGGYEHIFYGPHGEKCETRNDAVKLWEDWLLQQAEAE